MVDMREHPELSVPERRHFGKSEQTRVEALRRYRNGDKFATIAKWLGLNHNQVRYLLMQERVADGEVPRISPTAEAVRAALDAGGEFDSAAWVACRAGVVEDYVRRVGSSA